MRALKLEAYLKFPVQAYRPDSFDIANNHTPDSNFIVSRDRAGNIQSTYQDMEWDFTAYNLEGKPCKLLFNCWNSELLTVQRKALIAEIKYLIFSLIWLREKTLSFGTLRNYLSVLREIARYSEVNNLTLHKFLGDNKNLLNFLGTENKSGNFIEGMYSLFSVLNGITYSNFRFNPINKEFFQILKRHNIHYRASLKQYSPIPTRVFSQLLQNFTKYLENWEKVSDELLEVAMNCWSYRKSGNKIKPKYEKILDNSSENLKNYVSTHAQKFTLKNIISLLSDTQVICKLTIQAFTGMRDEEAQTLPYHCIRDVVSNSNKHYFICGRTTKFNRGNPKLTEWVTNIEAIRAVKIARKIADIVYHINNDVPIEGGIEAHQYPLFVSTTQIGLTGKPIELTSSKYRVGTLYSKNQLNKLIPLIEEVDIQELEQIDPHRAWRNEEKFQVGNKWHLTSHQFRRSLALYAQRSGLVSLPSLKRQLQHITIEMTSYYARGSSFAKNLIATDKNHFASEWQNTQPESACLSYINNVIMTDETLYGGHAHWVENILKKQNVINNIDREVTLKRFKKGEIFYRETIMGGCTKVGECSSTAISWLQINCLKENCRHMIVSLPKLERVISVQETMVDSLDTTSLEYRTEKQYLEILNDTKQKIIELKEESNV